MYSSLDSVRQLDDQSLVIRLEQCDVCRCETTAEVLLHLGEVDARRLYAEAGFDSMYRWCLESLNYSEGCATRYIRVARVGRLHPRLLELVATGALHVTGAALLAPRLKDASPELANELMDEAVGLSKRDIADMLAYRFPRTPVPDEVHSTLRDDDPAYVDPLAPDAYKVTFTASAALVAKLEEAQDLLVRPGGDLAIIVERGVDLLLTAVKKQRFGAGAVRPAGDPPTPVTVETEEPPSPVTVEAERSSARRIGRSAVPPQSDGEAARHVPAGIRAQVYRRDDGRCTFVARSGRRCDTRRDVQVHHIHPYAKGGRHTVPNLALLCRAHNDLLARREYGDACIDRHIRESRERARKTEAPDSAG